MGPDGEGLSDEIERSIREEQPRNGHGCELGEGDRGVDGERGDVERA